MKGIRYKENREARKMGQRQCEKSVSGAQLHISYGVALERAVSLPRAPTAAYQFPVDLIAAAHTPTLYRESYRVGQRLAQNHAEKITAPRAGAG